MQIAGQEILRVVASLVVHCCRIKNVIVASQLYDIAYAYHVHGRPQGEGAKRAFDLSWKLGPRAKTF